MHLEIISANVIVPVCETSRKKSFSFDSSLQKKGGIYFFFYLNKPQKSFDILKVHKDALGIIKIFLVKRKFFSAYPRETYPSRLATLQ